MRNITTVLEEAFPKKDMVMLDLFCGDGRSMTRHFSGLCSYLLGVDNEPGLAVSYLQSVGPCCAYVVNEDCIWLLNCKECRSDPPPSREFSLVSVDSPQGLYGNGYCEHFDMIWKVPPLVVSQSPGFILFNVNLQPFMPTSKAASKTSEGMKPEDFDEWMSRREKFYGHDPHAIDLNWMSNFYERQFGQLGWPFRFVCHYMRRSALPGHPDHIAYLLFRKG